jgi:hypothetical protein
MSECEKFEEALSALLDGELPDDRRQEVKAHLDSCEACKRVLAQWRKLSEAARAVGEPSGDAWESIWLKAEKGLSEKRGSLRLRREIRRAVVVAAIAASVLLAAFFWSPKTPILGGAAGPRTSEFEVVSIEAGPDYTYYVQMPQGKDLPVIWVENVQPVASGDDRS